MHPYFLSSWRCNALSAWCTTNDFKVFQYLSTHSIYNSGVGAYMVCKDSNAFILTMLSIVEVCWMWTMYYTTLLQWVCSKSFVATLFVLGPLLSDSNESLIFCNNGLCYIRFILLYCIANATLPILFWPL